jgi:hypothetical protein
MRLGKLDYQHDERTMALGNYIAPEIHIPIQFDFDKNRRQFVPHSWGNLNWGDCVMAGRANHLLRLERIEQRRTVPITDELVVEEYKAECQRQFGKSPASAGDANDNGLVVLYALRNWRNVGWTVEFKNTKRTYSIAAYGELDPNDSAQLRAACYLLHGIQFGFSLPKAAQGKDVWDYKGENNSEWKPGSWGGHLVYSKSYNLTGFEILTWGRKIFVTDSFIKRFCDEAWAVVDNLDVWRRRPEFDINTLMQYLRDIGARSIT